MNRTIAKKQHTSKALSVHGRWAKRIPSKGGRYNGYLLPVVIALGLAISTMSAYTMQAITQNSITVNEQYYKTLAKEAAQAGVAAALKCIESNKTTWGTNGKPNLQPQTDCDGADITNASKTIVNDTSVSTSYEVKSLEDPYGNASKIVTSTGVTTLKDFSGRKLTEYVYVARSMIAGSQSGVFVTGVATSDVGTCLISGGKPYCLGWNEFGMIGNGTTSSSTPVYTPTSPDMTGVLAGKTVTKIVTSGISTCAIADSKAYCWGTNRYPTTSPYFQGILGTGSLSNSYRPVAVKPDGVLAGKTVTDISSSPLSTCAIADGKAYCWGTNRYTVPPVFDLIGLLGDGSAVDYRAEPVAVRTDGVLAGKTATAISVGWTRTCVIADGKAYCWGTNQYGELGDSTNSYKNYPVAVKPDGVLSGKIVTAISAGANHTCAVADGKAYCWGRNDVGQLGDGTTANKNYPVAAEGVLSNKTVTAISAGNNHTCAVADGKAYCWGANFNGELGDGSNSNRSVPVAVKPDGVLTGKSVTDISTGYSNGYHVCAIADGKPYCWGLNDAGQLGAGAGANSNRPVTVNISTIPATVTALNSVEF